MPPGKGSPPSAVLVAASDVMAALRECVQAGPDALTFADSEPLQALQAITTHRPTLVVLERLFAATPRGAALINRIKADPSLTQLEVRVVSHTGDYVRTVSRPAAQPSATVEPATGADTAADSASPAVVTEAAPRPLDWHGTRRAPRFRMRPGVEIQLDGNTSPLVDLSTIGAQALSPRSLRPDQKVRVAITADTDVSRFRASVAWARFELVKPPASPFYRVGLEFIDADAHWLDAFCQKHKQ
jgi:hypothetical protein